MTSLQVDLSKQEVAGHEVVSGSGSGVRLMQDGGYFTAEGQRLLAEHNIGIATSTSPYYQEGDTLLVVPAQTDSREMMLTTPSPNSTVVYNTTTDDAQMH